MAATPELPPAERWRVAIKEAIDGKNIEEATEALLSIAYNDPDREWVERVITGCLDAKYDIQIRALAITCLGHVARIHRRIDANLVLPVLESLLQERELAGIVEDALADINQFASAI